MTPVVSPKPRRTAAAPAPRGLAVAVVGLGYVGLVTAACLARLGHRVVAVDIDELKIQRLSRGDVTLHEEGLELLVREQRAEGRLQFTSNADEALMACDLAFIAVGTPMLPDGSAEISAVTRVVGQLRGLARRPAVVVVKSTVPVGTTQALQAMLDDACEPGGAPPRVLCNPEFLREGCAVADFMQPDRIVIGDDGSDDAARRLLHQLYAPVIAAGTEVLVMDTRSAELTKCAANAMLAVRISFINEIASIAAANGADIEHVRRGIGSDHRIGSSFLQPGMGYGGSCLPKDLAALRNTARHSQVRSDMLLAAERINNRQRCWALDAIQADLRSHQAMRGLRVAVWGLAFKPGTDDMREAPSLVLIDRLVQAGVAVSLYDPVAMPEAQRRIAAHRRVHWAASAADALTGADALVLVTEWPEFAAFDPLAAVAAMKGRNVYDGRNALDATRWEAAGLRMVQVGRPVAPLQAPPVAAVVRPPAHAFSPVLAYGSQTAAA